MQSLLNKWRYFGLEPGLYHEGMKKVFTNNLYGLCRFNIIAAVFMACFVIFPLAVDHNKLKAGIYISSAVIALLLSIFSAYKLEQLKQGKHPGNQVIYLITVIYYMNLMLFSIYIGVWSAPDELAVIFMVLLICALLLLINPPLFNLCLTLGAFLIFLVSSVFFKMSMPRIFITDIVNAFLAFLLSLILSWQNSMTKIRFALNVSELENERNSFYNLSTIDELTQLKNRRDFTQAFQRFLVNYRQSDNFLYIAIMDIDFFKNYNDHYGHSEGDKCLRAIGKMLKDLQNSVGVYAARVGGEEFAMLWFAEDSEDVDSITTLISRKMRELNIPHEKSTVAPYVTVSIGVHIIRCGASTDMDALYDLADKALYAAKNNGRNCAVVSSSVF
ncbi:MAG: GGDEF domain-containing protein [Clostridiales bacterium]|jgi:diguanylate cyclase (GGDEF)-like protein|nr:GGDEF domain-containing protein [Clostridiales bacterium]